MGPRNVIVIEPVCMHCFHEDPCTYILVVLPTARRGPSTLLSMAMRSKSMTSELEELGKTRILNTEDQKQLPSPVQWLFSDSGEMTRHW